MITEGKVVVGQQPQRRTSRYRLWSYPPLGWIAYLPLFVAFLAPLLVICGLGTLLGVPSLIWHDQTGTKVVAGFALAVLFAELGVVGYLLDSRESPDQNVAPDAATVGSLASYVLCPLVTLFVVVAGSFILWHTGTGGSWLVSIGPAVVALLAAWLWRGPFRAKPLLGLFPGAVQGRARVVLAFMQQHAPERAGVAPDPGAHVVQIVAVAILGLVYAAFAVAVHFVQVPAAAAVSLAIGLAIAVWGLLRFWFRRWRIFWAGVLVLVACLVGVPGDVPVTGLAGVSFPKEGERPVPLVDDAKALDAWKATLKEARPPLVVVATSGGAVRAAIWTLNVLGHLEQRMPGFLGHVRIITGASGGMVGAAFLVSEMNQDGRGQSLDAARFTRLEEEVAKDALTPITSALILPGRDRGSALEQAWERSAPRLGHAFRDLRAGEEAGWLPSLIYAPMLVEDGRRLFVSNLELGWLARSLGPLATCAVRPCQQSVSALQLYACKGKGIATIKLSTVARLNATFPWVTSAARLTTDPDRRVVDAGYYDNYGVDIATAWVHKNAAWLQKNTSGVLLLQIRDEVAASPSIESAKAPGEVHGWFSALSTPVEGFFNAWSASMSFRNDQKVEVLADDPHLDPRSRFFTTTVFSFAGRAPLEWYLDRAAIEELKQPPSENEVAALARWWAERLPQRGAAAAPRL